MLDRLSQSDIVCFRNSFFRGNDTIHTRGKDSTHTRSYDCIHARGNDSIHTRSSLLHQTVDVRT